MKIKLEFKWHDKWVGVYDKKKLEITFGDMQFGYAGLEYEVIRTWYQHIWICVVPCLPIHVWWEIDPEKAVGRYSIKAGSLPA